MGSAFYYSVWITSAPPKKDAPYWRAPSLGSNQVQAVTKLGFVAIRWLVLATPGVREKKQMISKEKIKVWKRRCSLQPHVDSPMPLPTTRVRVWGGYCSYTALWCPGSLSRDHHKAQPCASQTLEVLRRQAPGHGPLQFSLSPLKWGPKRGHCTPAVDMTVPGKGKVHGESTGKALWASASSCRPMHGAHHHAASHGPTGGFHTHVPWLWKGA